ncbi:hypothetical protein AAX26_01797 [Aliarcobacter thereius]|uniref:hypothetical protein n=1 Tax=Aliarcobacter thereius TaxID=544718 RepID=UPI00082790C9|nr:hypothetical protein [Aliarcobacter thereius]OCL85730.1 hypothetical protein AAX26_01797 [Aliarcobacter thereius]OCL86096.1 hypothetical protein AAX27_02115 [Aliarcobacter thereius]
MAVNHLIDKNWWKKRDNLKNKPSLSYKTLEVISQVMKDEEIALGTAIEKLMTTPNLYKETIEKLKSDYPDIEEE